MSKAKDTTKIELETLTALKQPIDDEVILANRRYDIAKHCIGMLAFGTVPDIMGNREID